MVWHFFLYDFLYDIALWDRITGSNHGIEPRDRVTRAKMNFDYIIVGAGSAGCVLANRLSSNPGNSVLLIEAGPEDKALSLKMPAAVLSNLQGTKHNWAFQGEPEPELNNRRLQHDRGKTLGGSSSINGMLYCLLYTSPSPRDQRGSRMPSSA